ncbi:MAG: sensor histidine kinase [Bacteroidota bacterium]
MLLLAIAVIAFFLVYQKRLFAQEESLRAIETAYQKELLQHSFVTQEAERKRIASDLHDDLGSILSATKIYLYQLNQKQAAPNYQNLKKEATELVDTAINQVRSISHNLFPPDLEHLGFLSTIENFCQRIQKMNNIDLSFHYDSIPSLTKQQELMLYRILQELVNNTLKHAQATQIKLLYKTLPKGFRMKYQDNGVGFEIPPKKNANKGIGIKNIESRANAINATFQFQSTADEGMWFTLDLPR